MRGRLFFFYGTLTHEHDNPASAAAMGLMTLVGRGAVRGSLLVVAHQAGWYPVLDRRGRDWVRGWLYRAGGRFDRSALVRLDRYEEADRRWPEYRRQRVRVRIGGRIVAAEAYVHARPVHAGMKRVASGDFAAFVGRCAARSFGSGTTARGGR